MTDQLTQPEPAILSMPSDVTLVRETVDSFDTEPSRSRLMGVEKPMLVELGVIIVDKDRHAHEGFEHMVAEFGDAAVRKSAYYEFVAEFRSRFDRIRRRYRERMARLNIEHATKGHGDDMASVLQVQLMRLLAEKAVSTDDLAQLEGKELGAMIAMIDGWTRAAMKREEIDLKIADGERKAQKLEADLSVVRQRISKLPDQIKALQVKVDEVAASATQGKRIAPEVFTSIRQELIAMAQAAQASQLGSEVAA